MLLLAGVYLYHRGNDELRAHLLNHVQQKYPHLVVRLAEAELVGNEGIRIRQLSLTKPESEQSQATQLIYAEEINILCDPNLQDLVQGKLTIESVQIHGLISDVVREVDGRWNVETLIPSSPTMNLTTLPEVVVQGGVVQYTDRSLPTNPVLFKELDLRLKLKALLNRQQQSTGNISAQLDGTVSTDFCRQIAIKGSANSSDKSWVVSGEMREVKWSQALIDVLPVEIPSDFIDDLKAEAHIKFSAAQRPDQSSPQFRVNGVVNQGQWHPPRLHQPMTNLRANFKVDNRGVAIQQLSATLGAGKIQSELHLNGFNLEQPYALSMTATQFPITPRLIEALPESLQETWRKYRPIGTVSGRLQITHNGQVTEHDAEFTSQDLSLLHYKHQYPVTNCRGTARLYNGLFDFHLDGLAGRTPITIKGSLRNPGPLATGWCEVRTSGWKPIDDALIRALPPKTQQLAHKLQIRGDVGFWIRFERTEPTLKPPKPHLKLVVNEGWINYEDFPYPISDIRGEIVWLNGNWAFRGLKGVHGDSPIRCDGFWNATVPERPLELNFLARQVMMGPELKRALKPNTQRIWESFRPQGSIEELRVSLRKTDASPRPAVDIRAIQRPQETRPLEASSLSVQPTWFPYHLGEVSGQAHWLDGELVIQQLMARHDETTIRTNISGSVSADGAWRMNLTNFSVDNIRLDNDLIHALPKGFSDTINRIDANGIFSLDGAAHFARQHSQSPVEAGWDLAVQLDQVSLQAGLPVNHVFGEVNMRGSSFGPQFWSRGTLNVDSMFVRGIQLTQLQGPIWIDSTRVALGRRVPPADRQQPSKMLSAKVYEGKVEADLEMTLGEFAEFNTQLRLENANVSTLSRDLRLGNGNLSGQATAALNLRGSSRGRHTFNGSGNLRLRNANMYELPIVLAVLSRIGSGKADNTAFNSSDVVFGIRDGYVYFKQFDLSGDTITLKGIGEMSLDRELNLDFYSLVGSEGLWSPLVRPFLGEASRQFLQIHVDGTLDAPVTRQEVLPGLNETLQQLFPELIVPTPPAANTSRRFLPRWK